MNFVFTFLTERLELLTVVFASPDKSDNFKSEGFVRLVVYGGAKDWYAVIIVFLGDLSCLELQITYGFLMAVWAFVVLGVDDF